MLLDPIVIAIELEHPLLPLQALQFDYTLIASQIWGKQGAKGVSKWVKFWSHLSLVHAEVPGV